LIKKNFNVYVQKINPSMLRPRGKSDKGTKGKGSGGSGFRYIKARI
jgi:hypothetical protein